MDNLNAWLRTEEELTNLPSIRREMMKISTLSEQATTREELEALKQRLLRVESYLKWLEGEEDELGAKSAKDHQKRKNK